MCFSPIAIVSGGGGGGGGKLLMMMMTGYLEGMSGIMLGINAQEAGFRIIISRRMGDGFWGFIRMKLIAPF